MKQEPIQNFPDHIRGLPRRLFLKGMAGAAAAAYFPFKPHKPETQSLRSLSEAVANITGNQTGDEKF